MIPAPFIESPLTWSKKEASGRVIRYSSMERMSQRASSSGEGKPARMDPRRATAKGRFVRLRWPVSSRASRPAAISFPTQKWTTLFERTPNRPIISA